MSFTPTPAQQAIINHTKGPCLIIAGPGSGKTFTLVERILHLLVDEQIPPERLFVATFTEKAARELQDRIARALLEKGFNINLEDMYLGTFHSICLKILEEYSEFTNLKKNFTVMDKFDQEYFFYQNFWKFNKKNPFEIMQEEKKKENEYQPNQWAKANSLCAWMNLISEEMVDYKRLIASKNPQLNALGQWYELYQEMLEEENRLDFSHLQADVIKLLEIPEIQKELREKIQYIMVDEYQDTNSVQEKIIFKLLNEKNNICVVGDDDQGIYRFRGATIRNIFEFPDHFAPGECERFDLVTNYRSDPEIIEFYNRWMDDTWNAFSWEDGQKKFRFYKNITPPPDKKSTGNAVFKVAGSVENEDWHEQILKFLNYLKDGNHIADWSQVAFLFYSVRNPKVKALLQYLEKHHVPVYSPRSDLFFERNEIKLVIGAFVSLFPILTQINAEKPFKLQDLWDYYALCLKDFLDEMAKPENAQLREWHKKTFRQILAMAATSHALDFGFSGLFYQLLQYPIFASYLSAGETNRDERAAFNLAYFSQMLVKFEYLYHIEVLHPKFLKKNVDNFFNSFLRFLKKGGVNEFEDEQAVTPHGAVAFMTIHQSKGLEFPVTVVGSIEAVPTKKTKEVENLLADKGYLRKPFEPEEFIKFFDFKRLFYTAFSRAENLLVLTTQVRTGKKPSPSKYFRPFFIPLPDWKEVNLSTLKLELKKKGQAKRRYSYTSHILVYEGCPRQYQFFKHWEFSPVREGPMLFGQLVHQTIEDIHKHALRGEADAITPDNVRQWFDVNYANLSHKERIYLRDPQKEVAYQQVLDYVNRKDGDWSDIKETEVDVSLVKDDYILTGKIDLIKGEGNACQIVDFKSTPRPDMDENPEILKRYKRQLEIYAHLVEERYGQRVDGLHLYYTGEKELNPLVSFPYKRSSVNHTISEIEDVIAEIEKRNFTVQERSEKLCKECDLNAFCDRSHKK